uniref:Uncharacterized protein n=1 Tax=Trypanosoma vivax (strain Y486) TaxID=1055687 RepID=G0UCZ5_TRYVY|nr:hypothetical protein TVY486_1111890 [Trypanosoma vivax Y486]
MTGVDFSLLFKYINFTFPLLCAQRPSAFRIDLLHPLVIQRRIMHPFPRCGRHHLIPVYPVTYAIFSKTAPRFHSFSFPRSLTLSDFIIILLLSGSRLGCPDALLCLRCLLYSLSFHFPQAICMS